MINYIEMRGCSMKTYQMLKGYHSRTCFRPNLLFMRSLFVTISFLGSFFWLHFCCLEAFQSQTCRSFLLNQGIALQVCRNMSSCSCWQLFEQWGTELWLCRHHATLSAFLLLRQGLAKYVNFFPNQSFDPFFPGRKVPWLQNAGWGDA